MRTLWLIVTMVLGVIFVWMMVRVYNSIDTVRPGTASGRRWFFLTMFMGWPVTGLPVVESGWRRWLGDGVRCSAISVLALVVSGVVSVMQGAELATIHSSVQQAAALVPDYGALMSCGFRFWRCPVLVDRTTAKRLSACGSATIRLIHSASQGELIGRGDSYGLHMTVGDGRRKLISNNRGFGPSFLFISASLTCHNWSSNYDNQECG
ncbi:DmsC/YnfH family molybdoenzyme membrane anchor subunit [Shigella flexneri]